MQCANLSSRLQQEHSTLSSQATEVSQMSQLIDIKSAAVQELEAEVAVKRERIQVCMGQKVRRMVLLEGCCGAL